jgi:hypothetical protein
MAFGETNVPANETGSVVQFGSGSNARNMMLAISKTGVNTSFLGNDGTQTMLGSEGGVPITFRTSINYNAANIMASGAEVMRITSAGNVGIGTNTPTQKLDVTGTVNASTGFLTDESIRVDADETNTGTKFPGVLFGGTTTGETITSNRDGNSAQKWGLDFWTASQQRMTIANNGNVGIGAPIPNYKLTVAGVVAPSVDNTYSLGGSTTNRWTSVFATNGAIQTSDRRLKTNIKNLGYGLKEVLAMQPVSYNWKEKPDTDNKIGLIAQDINKLVPEVVTGDETKESLGMNYAELVPVLINAIKDQQKQIDELKDIIKKLKK